MGFYSRTVTTVETELTAYNKSRTSISIMNLGVNRVFISQNPANIAAEGWPLDPGWAIGLSVIDGDEPDLALHAVAGVGSNNVRIVEQYGNEQIARMHNVLEGV